jgi:hypothetical protein
MAHSENNNVDPGHISIAGAMGNWSDIPLPAPATSQQCLTYGAFQDVRRRSVTSIEPPSRPRRIFLHLLLGLAALPLVQSVPAQTLVVIVNPSIGVPHLSRREVLDIFLGRYRSFPTGASALPIDLDVSSNERKAFYQLLAHKDSSDMGSYWARLTFSGKISPPFAVPDAQTAIDIVAHNPNAIAYVDRAAVDQRVRIALELTP